jgi:hypothetical protein
VLVGTDPVGSVHAFGIERRTGHATRSRLRDVPRNLA